MSHATLVYPHQLFPHTHPAYAIKRTVYLIEEPLLITEFPTHCQKQLLHRLSMRAYVEELQAHDMTVEYFDVRTYTTTEAVFNQLKVDGVTNLHISDVTDDWLRKRIEQYATACTMTIHWYASALFIVEDDYEARYLKSKRHLASFYKQMRLDYGIMLDVDGNPEGGQWSFDSENRKKLPKDIDLPAMDTSYNDAPVEEALLWQKELPGEHYGEAKVWLPYTRAGAQKFLQQFLRTRLNNFGPYEDAISPTHPRLFHSTLSPLINIGLLSPREVIDAAIAYAKDHAIPLPSLEGFVRQILGWREFIRAAYEVDGQKMRTTNFFNHTRPLPLSFWSGTTTILPIDTAIKHALTYGYNHHIERLMVLGNFMLLTQTNPDEVYRWFMAMYVDAYDWVMVPNVYGMSQFADGGLFATKPYIAGGNYLTKMSSYPKGTWDTLYTGLYWHFIGTHSVFFLNNHRLSMMPRLLEKMAPATRHNHETVASEYFTNSD